MLSLSQRNRDRLVVLHQARQGQLTMVDAARRIGIGPRHFRRLLRRFEREGDGVVVHGLRGRPSNRQLSVELQERSLEKAGEPGYRDFGPTLLTEHLAREGIFVRPVTLRRWMIKAGLWQPTRQGKRHRSRRERRAAFGELVLMDTSEHAWLEQRSEEKLVLIALIDDATSEARLRFYPRDTGAANREMIIDYLSELGRMGALYTDQASHFKVNWGARARHNRDQAEALTVIRRGLDELGIELILALSPQAKGRVERLFKTLQDRLVKELRIAGVSTLEAANRFLDEEFLPFWKQRFTIAPREATPALRPLPAATDLLRVFCDTDERVVRSDFTFRFKNQHFQILKHEAEPRMPGSHVVIEQRLDGTVRYRWCGAYLTPRPLPSERCRQPVTERITRAPKPPPVVKPAPNHPWRQYRVRFPTGVAPAGV